MNIGQLKVRNRGSQDYRGCGFVKQRPNWRFTVYPTGALPHFELPGPFEADYDNFLAVA